MESFSQHTGIAVPLLRANIDTDQIIPKQFLKRLERNGYGDFLFFDWRFDVDGSVNDQFVLNDSIYAGASILIAGSNFGCGSSREHAAWALRDYGFRVVIAPSFADIFVLNATQNGILAIPLADADVSHLSTIALRRDRSSLVVDLQDCVIADPCGSKIQFSIDASQRTRLLNGLDDIGMTLLRDAAITAYERQRRRTLPSMGAP